MFDDEGFIGGEEEEYIGFVFVVDIIILVIEELEFLMV